MAKSARAKPQAFRRARLRVASLIALALGCAATAFIGYTDAGRTLELTASDALRRAKPLPDEPVTAKVTVVEIDDKAMDDKKTYDVGGRWPWSRPKQARLIDALASLGARWIVLDIEYSEAEPSCVGYRPRAESTELDTYVLEKPDLVFGESLERAGNVVVPFSVYFKGRSGDSDDLSANEKEVLVPEHLRRFAVNLPPAPDQRLREAEDTNPMVAKLADVAAGSGYTSLVKQEDPDQAVRRVPVLARAGDCVFPHLGVEMAGLWRFGPGYQVRLSEGRFALLSADGKASVGVPIDAKGQLEFRWPTAYREEDNIHMSAHPVLAVVHARRELDTLQQRWRLAMEELDALFPAHQWGEARRALDAAEARATASPDDTAAQEAVKACRDALEKVEERLVMDLIPYASATGEAGGADLEKRRADAARRCGPLISVYHENRDKNLAYLKEATAIVRPRIEGHLCIVGLNITAGTDQHKTPISRGQPGVTIYPSVMRTILSGVAFRHLAGWQDFAIAVLAALLVGVLGSRLSTGWGIAATVGLSTVVVVIGYIASATVAMLLPVAAPVSAIVLAFAGVSAYRQLTEASSRRWITRAFGQYMSPAVLDELVRNPELLRLGGARRDVTIIFSDVVGFTPLSENLDAETLGSLLNHYLGIMTGMLHAEDATLDKYEGDGIMAFVGAPIEAPDHALRAVRAALRMQEAVPKVRADLVAMGLMSADQPLAIRVGCSSGPANVGNFGSEQRFDYTAMGDTVNLGGRLEEANRWLGTKILVPQTTRDGCGDAILFRRMGHARIRGKAQPMPLYEPLALEPADEKLKAVAGTFGRAIDALKTGDVDAAEAALADLVAIDPDDGPAQALRTRIEYTRAGALAPEEPWNLARPKEDAPWPDAQ